MPIYEYLCEQCGNEFELLVFKNDNPVCPACGEKEPKRKMSSFGFSVGYKFKPSSTSTGSSGCASCGSSNCSSCG
ncbi:MAG: zinc ribbon domain-containing protein [Proteobacteria bacterium]|nr:zinc ribbon domain-containing protein [Pseudomonadota bacterium]